jgi:hypothetical protein
MLDAEVVFQSIRQLSIFDDQDHAARHFRMIGNEHLQLFIGFRATRTLRAMLEKNNRFFLRTFEEGPQILFLVKFNEHDRRVADGNGNEEQRIAGQGNHR